MALSDPRRAWLGLRRRMRHEPAPEPEAVQATQDAQLALWEGWLPAPSSVRVSVVAAAGMAEYHRRIWASATSGPFRCETIPCASHKDLLSYRARGTGEAVARWLRTGDATRSAGDAAR
jgi:hypothetical protein